MIMDKLGIAHQYQNKKLTLELEDYDQINYSDYEEALAEFYALTKTLFDPLILPDLGVDLSHSICEPVKTIFTTYDPPHLKGIKVNVEETIAYQPVSYTKFISLKRPHPYSLVNDLWKDYFSNVIINKLLKYSVIAGSGFKAAKVISPIAKLPLIEKPYEYLFKKIFDLFTLNDNWADRENSFDVHVYLVGVDENEIFNLNLSCNDLA
ncbi:MAG: hypothetical protein B6U89_05730 [Desulfurococcales archaeon ex4484_58]|nr:MAG: hypothetical protein B6U89_05730 [Desulfurococcales archaeon ex4484_58]